MLTLDRPSGRTDAGEPLTLDEFPSLPAGTRAEIVAGVLRPMTRSKKVNRTVQRGSAQPLEQLAPVDLTVFDEEAISPTTATVADPALPWAAVGLTPLLGYFA